MIWYVKMFDIGRNQITHYGPFKVNDAYKLQEKFLDMDKRSGSVNQYIYDIEEKQ